MPLVVDVDGEATHIGLERVLRVRQREGAGECRASTPRGVQRVCRLMREARSGPRGGRGGVHAEPRVQSLQADAEHLRRALLVARRAGRASRGSAAARLRRSMRRPRRAAPRSSPAPRASTPDRAAGRSSGPIARRPGSRRAGPRCAARARCPARRSSSRRSCAASREALVAALAAVHLGEEVLGEQDRRPRRARAAAAARSGTRSGGRAGPRAACPRATACCGSRFVAAITRTSTAIGSVAADAVRACRVSSTRSSFTCSSIGISVISSRNSVPPLARSNRPPCRRSAPVKLPRSWPNSSLSISVRRDGAAVDGDERLLAPARELVHGLRDELLAGPALAGHEHGRLGRRDARDQVVDLLHRASSARSAARSGRARAAPRAARRPRGAARPGAARAPSIVCEPAPVDGLRQVVERALLQRLDRGVDAALSGDHDERGALADRLVARELEALAVGQPEIDQHHVGRAARRAARAPLRARPPGARRSPRAPRASPCSRRTRGRRR